MNSIFLKLIFFCFTLLIFKTDFYSQASAFSLDHVQPEVMQVSKERLQLLDQHIEKYIKEGHLAGGVFALARKGKVIYLKSFGERSPGISYHVDDIFRLASMTKAMTTIGIMQLLEDGQLLLDDPIHYYLPEFKEMEVAHDINQADSTYTLKPSSRPITIRHLLTHTSGITYGSFQGGAIQAMYEKYGANAFGLSHDSLSTQEMIKVLARVPLIFEPGTQYSYGLNMEVLGAIIEKVSNMNLRDYMRKKVLDPLEMKETDYILQEKLHDRLVPVYTYDEDRNLIISDNKSLDYPLALGRNHFAGGGGMSGSTLDYLKLTIALLNDGKLEERRILSRKSIDLITSDQMILLNEQSKGFSKLPGITYGLGFQLKTEEGRGVSMKSPGTFEWGGYFNTKYFIDQEEELTFVGMTQVVPFYRNDFWEKAYAIIYSALK